MNKEIEDKVIEINNLIKESDNYKKYLSLKEIIKNDKEINEYLDYITRIKKLLANNIDVQNNKILLEKYNNLLNNNPLYREYKNTLDEINNTYNIIETTINNYFKDKLN